ncbi:TPA: hypothetical protein ACLG1T_000136 [Pseudomonas aeruginosa]|nr:hypothetical protein [Pseudomonas aeruginosa]
MQTVMIFGLGCGTVSGAARQFYDGAAVAFRRFSQRAEANPS